MTKRVPVFRAVAALVLVAVCAACSVGRVHAPSVSPFLSSSGRETSGSNAERYDAMIRNIRGQAITLAAEKGDQPGANQMELVDWGGDGDPAFVWQEPRGGDVCIAEAGVVWSDLEISSVELQCTSPAGLTGGGGPGLRSIFESYLNRAADGFDGIMLSTSEEVESISCSGKSFPVHEIMEGGPSGAKMRLYWVAFPLALGGDYTAEVQHDGVRDSQKVHIYAKGAAACH